MSEWGQNARCIQGYLVDIVADYPNQLTPRRLRVQAEKEVTVIRTWSCGVRQRWLGERGCAFPLWHSGCPCHLLQNGRNNWACPQQTLAVGLFISSQKNLSLLGQRSLEHHRDLCLKKCSEPFGNQDCFLETLSGHKEMRSGKMNYSEDICPTQWS